MSTPTKAAEIRGPITHELKCHPEPFQAVKRGDKPFEWRKDDRDYRVGDTLWLMEWGPLTMWGHRCGVPRTIDPHYTGDECHRLTKLFTTSATMADLARCQQRVKDSGVDLDELDRITDKNRQ